MDRLVATGLQKIPSYALHTFGSPPDSAYGLENESCWPAFMEEGLPQLRHAGWQVELADDFRHHAFQIESWEADLTESENGWFDLDMGGIVEGERLPVAPLLAALFRNDPRWLATWRTLRRRCAPSTRPTRRSLLRSWTSGRKTSPPISGAGFTPR